MDGVFRQLVALVDSPDFELRCAAIRVLSEVGITSKTVVQALGKCLREPNKELQVLALKALGQLGAGDVGPLVAPLILNEGVLGDHAMAVVTAVGPKMTPHLQRLYQEADARGKRAVVTALSTVGGHPAIEFLIERLPDEPFDLQNHLLSAICDAVERAPESSQAAIFRRVADLLQSRAARDRQTQISAIIMLGYVRSRSLVAKARDLLRKYTEKRRPSDVRRYSLISLGRLTSAAKLPPDYLAFLKKMLCDPDWQNVAQHALTSFQRIEMPAKSMPLLLEILRATPHAGVQRHIFARLEALNRPEVVRHIITFLADPRDPVRDLAQKSLQRLPLAVGDVFRELLTTEDIEVAQRLNSILAEFPVAVRRRYLARAAQALVRFFDKNDERYVSFLSFVRSVDPGPLRQLLYQKANALKAGKSREKWRKISSYLKILWDNHLITPEGRYLFAVALIRLSSKDLAPDARRANLGLQVLRAVIYDDQACLVKSLMKDRDLKPEDYFYLGFNFSEEGEQARPFGIAMLEHVVKVYPRSQVRGLAAHKLETQQRAYEKDLERANKKKSRSRPTKSAARVPTASEAGGRSHLTIREGASTAAARATRRRTGPDSSAAGPVATALAKKRESSSAAKKESKAARERAAVLRKKASKPKPKTVSKPKPKTVSKPKPKKVSKPRPKKVSKPKPKKVSKPGPKKVSKPLRGKKSAKKRPAGRVRSPSRGRVS